MLWPSTTEGELDRAITDYNETMRLDPTYIFAFNTRGRLHGQEGL